MSDSSLGEPGGTVPGTPARLPQVPGYADFVLLGSGSQGLVVKARHLDLGREVVLKFLRPEFLADAGMRERFFREARVTARLAHPNIVRVLALEDAHGAIVYELVPGETLAARLARIGRFETAEALDLARQAAAGLAGAHKSGIVHRDVKPENLLLASDGVLKVLDFGLAASEQLAARRTRAGAIMGTPAYMPPEQAAGERVGPPADIYSLGATLYELLAGRPPYLAGGPMVVLAAVLAGPPPSLAGLVADLPGPVLELVSVAMARAPAERHASMKAMELALRAALPAEPRRRDPRRTQSGIRQSPRAVLTSAQRPAAKATGHATPRRWLFAALPVLVLAAGVLWTASRRETEPTPPAPTPEQSAGASAPATTVPTAVPRVQIFCGAKLLRVTWDPPWPRPVTIRYGVGAKLEQARIAQAGKSSLELGGLRSQTSYCLQPIWGGAPPSPVLTAETLSSTGPVVQLAKAPKGAFWTLARDRVFSFFPDDPVTFRFSDDDGLSWSIPQKVPVSAASGQVAADSLGEVLWLAALGKTATGARLQLVSTRDSGRSWTKPVSMPVADYARSASLHALACREGVDVLCCWKGPEPVSGSTVVYRLRFVAGRAQPSLSDAVGPYLGGRCFAARTDDGSLHVVGGSIGVPPELLYTRSARPETGWEPAVAFPGQRSEGNCFWAAGSGLSLWVLWEGTGGRTVWLLGSRDAGKTWDRPPRRVDLPSDLPESGGERYAIAAAGDAVEVAYVQESGDVQNPFVLARSRDGGATFPERVVAPVPFLGGTPLKQLLRTPRAAVLRFSDGGSFPCAFRFPEAQR